MIERVTNARNSSCETEAVAEARQIRFDTNLPARRGRRPAARGRE